jgi:hypothetical protein
MNFGQRRQALKKALIRRTFFQRTTGYSALGGSTRRSSSASGSVPGSETT